MGSILFWLGALVVVSLLSPVLKVLIAATVGKQIGASALAQQPDRIHLQKATPEAWKNRRAAERLAQAFETRGFSDAGVYTIAELPIVVQLLANGGDSFYAAIYQHPQVGTWFDLFSHFEDGTSVTYSTAKPNALKPRPGHPTVNLHGAEPDHVLEKAKAQRPRRPLKAVSAWDAVGVFEKAYEDSMAYRKGVGISTGEVVGQAMRKVA